MTRKVIVVGLTVLIAVGLGLVGCEVTVAGPKVRAKIMNERQDKGM